jgi:hypothetical protein
MPGDPRREAVAQSKREDARMLIKRKRTAATVALIAITLLAAEMVGVPGSSTKYPSEIESSVGGKNVKMVLTGAALRTKFIVNVYTIASYVQQDATVRTAEALATADCAKRLHLVMERTVDGKDMAEAFRAAIRMNHPEPEFNEEVNTLVQFMRSTSARKDDHICLTHVPGIGLHCSMAGRAEFLIKSVRFAQAVWEIYLGKNNLGESIKKSLVSRL